MEVETLKESKELALFLGMFVGDGCFSIVNRNNGYVLYPIKFYNTDERIINLFSELFFYIFGIRGYINTRQREGRKKIWEFQKYSKEIYDIIKFQFYITDGRKASKVGIPEFILEGSKEMQKYFFYGLLITDGRIDNNEQIIFNCASSRLIDNLQNLVENVWGIKCKTHAYIQRDKFWCFRIILNRSQSSIILAELPGSRNLVSHRILLEKLEKVRMCKS